MCMKVLRLIHSHQPLSLMPIQTAFRCGFSRLYHSNMAESLNTLRYAGRAMNIKNTAVKNEGLTGPPVSYAEVSDP